MKMQRKYIVISVIVAIILIISLVLALTKNDNISMKKCCEEKGGIYYFEDGSGYHNLSQNFLDVVLGWRCQFQNGSSSSSIPIKFMNCTG